MDVDVVSVLNKGGVVRVECRASDGRVLEADCSRAAKPEGLVVGARMKLRPRRVFVFPETAAP